MCHCAFLYISQLMRAAVGSLLGSLTFSSQGSRMCSMSHSFLQRGRDHKLLFPTLSQLSSLFRPLSVTLFSRRLSLSLISPAALFPSSLPSLTSLGSCTQRRQEAAGVWLLVTAVPRWGGSPRAQGSPAASSCCWPPLPLGQLRSALAEVPLPRHVGLSDIFSHWTTAPNSYLGIETEQLRP